jgi:hypothetical protein
MLLTTHTKYKHRINAHRHPCLEWDSNPYPRKELLIKKLSYKGNGMKERHGGKRN